MSRSFILILESKTPFFQNLELRFFLMLNEDKSTSSGLTISDSIFSFNVNGTVPKYFPQSLQI